MSEYNGAVVDPKKPLLFRSWRRTRLPYNEMANALQAGHAYFIEDLKRQTAHSAAQSLTKRTRFKVTAVSGMYDGKKGYIFFKEGPDSWVKKWNIE